MTDAIRDLLHAHEASPYPPALSADAEAAGISLAMLDADIAGLAHTLLDRGALRRDQWLTLESATADARTALAALDGDAWVYVGRLYALAKAMLRVRPR